MTTAAENTVQGGLEVSHLTAITHAVDDQKNRQRQQRRKRKRPPDPPPEPVDQNDDETLDDQDGDGHTVDYLA